MNLLFLSLELRNFISGGAMQVIHPEGLLSSIRPSFPISLTQLYINGEWRDSANGKTFAAIDPTTEAEIAQVAEGTVEDVEDAVKAANAAFETGDWSRLSGHERGEILWKVGDLFLTYGEELAFLQAKEMGRLFSDSMTVDIPHLINMFHYYAGWASKIEGSVKQTTKAYTLIPSVNR
jgi:aldehyde dehydrogenase (NAD+)